jgi:hypothetical protein
VPGQAWCGLWTCVLASHGLMSSGAMSQVYVGVCVCGGGGGLVTKVQQGSLLMCCAVLNNPRKSCRTA